MIIGTSETTVSRQRACKTVAMYNSGLARIKRSLAQARTASCITSVWGLLGGLHIADDTSGLTFQEWDPSAGTDDTSVPVAMLVNSSELRAADFPLPEVRPLHLDAVARGGRRTRGAAVRKLQGVGNSTFVLSVENDDDFRSRCE